MVPEQKGEGCEGSGKKSWEKWKIKNTSCGKGDRPRRKMHEKHIKGCICHL